MEAYFFHNQREMVPSKLLEVKFKSASFKFLSSFSYVYFPVFLYIFLGNCPDRIFQAKNVNVDVISLTYIPQMSM